MHNSKEAYVLCDNYSAHERQDLGRDKGLWLPFTHDHCAQWLDRWPQTQKPWYDFTFVFSGAE